MTNDRLSALPTEILCHIFESIDSFTTVTALARTSRIFNSIWQTFQTPICEAVIRRAITNPIAAERLLETKEVVHVRSDIPIDESSNHVLVRAKRLHANARSAYHVFNYYMAWSQFDIMHMDPSILNAQLARFEYAFYTIWTLSLWDITRSQQLRVRSVVQNASPRDTYVFRMLGIWACKNKEVLVALCPGSNNQTWMHSSAYQYRRFVMLRGRGHFDAIPSQGERHLKGNLFDEKAQQFLDLISEYDE